MADDTAAGLLALLRSRRGEMISLLRRLAEAESPSLEPETQRGPFALLAAALETSGCVVRRVRGTATGDHLYAVPRRRARSPLPAPPRSYGHRLAGGDARGDAGS